MESAIACTQHCKELLIEDKIHEKKMYVQQMRSIFNEIDVDKSGTISIDELTEFLTDDGFQQYLEALDLNPSDTATLFKLIDFDDSGSVDINEFCDGCIRLKGEAKSFDINCILYNIRKMSKHISILRDQVGSRSQAFPHLTPAAAWCLSA